MALVSHDISLVASPCEEPIIVEGGRIVESGKSGILAASRHAYTQKLLVSIHRMPA